MNCPKCGQKLVPSKKDPNYMLCYECKKKYKVPGSTTDSKEQRYSNIPPKPVREKREKEMRKAYKDMISAEEDPKRRKKGKRQELEDDYDYSYEDDKVSKAPVIILGIAILIVAGLIIYMLLK